MSLLVDTINAYLEEHHPGFNSYFGSYNLGTIGSELIIIHMPVPLLLQAE